MSEEAPQHAYLSRHWSNYFEHRCQFSYERRYQDDIEYVRTQPPTADAAATAKEIVDGFKSGSTTSALLTTSIEEDRLRADIATALSAAKQQGRDEQREKDARLVEGYHENLSTNDYNIAAAIRSNQ